MIFIFFLPAESMTKTVREAMQVIENKTCVRFVEYEAQREVLEIRSLPNRGCYAVIGRRPGKKVVPMNLQVRFLGQTVTRYSTEISRKTFSIRNVFIVVV